MNAVEARAEQSREISITKRDERLIQNLRIATNIWKYDKSIVLIRRRLSLLSLFELLDALLGHIAHPL